MTTKTTKAQIVLAPRLSRPRSRRDGLPTAPIAVLRERMITAFDGLRPKHQRPAAKLVIAFAALVQSRSDSLIQITAGPGSSRR